MTKGVHVYVMTDALRKEICCFCGYEILLWDTVVSIPSHFSRRFYHGRCWSLLHGRQKSLPVLEKNTKSSPWICSDE
jgi:hypothetical protein